MPETISTPSVPVVVATPGHLNKKTFYQAAQAMGAFILSLNLWLMSNPDMVHLAAGKYVWVGPAVSAIARVAEALQTHAQKARTQQVNNTLPTSDPDALLDAALTTPVKE